VLEAGRALVFLARALVLILVWESALVLILALASACCLMLASGLLWGRASVCYLEPVLGLVCCPVRVSERASPLGPESFPAWGLLWGLVSEWPSSRLHRRRRHNLQRLPFQWQQEPLPPLSVPFQFVASVFPSFLRLQYTGNFVRQESQTPLDRSGRWESRFGVVFPWLP
jgi:hypothetical protein